MCFSTQGDQHIKDPNPRNTNTHSRTCGREGLYLLFSQEKIDISIPSVTKPYKKKKIVTSCKPWFNIKNDTPFWFF